jgi:hypothetical protein
MPRRPLPALQIVELDIKDRPRSVPGENRFRPTIWTIRFADCLDLSRLANAWLVSFGQFPSPMPPQQEVTMQPGAVPAMTMHPGMSQVGAMTRALSPGFTVPFFGCFDVGCTACMLSFLAPCYMTALSQVRLRTNSGQNGNDSMTKSSMVVRSGKDIGNDVHQSPCTSQQCFA